MDSIFEPLECNDDDVLSFGNATFKIGNFRKPLNHLNAFSLGQTLFNQLHERGIVIHNNTGEDYVALVHEGRDCEILNLGSKNKWDYRDPTVRFPGVRMAPISRTCAYCHIRLENSGANAMSRPRNSMGSDRIWITHCKTVSLSCLLCFLPAKWIKSSLVFEP